MAEVRFPRSILVCCAHPDDTEISSAGTLKLLAQRGFKVTVCTMTAGGMGGIGSNERSTIRIRKAEAAKAAALLGAEYVCLDARDGYLYDTERLRLAMNDLIRRVKAGIVLTHLPMDYHPDHRATAAIVEAALLLSTLPNVPCRNAPLEVTPLFYHSAPFGRTDPLGQKIAAPHFYVDIASVSEFKASMLACHQSQIELMRIMHHMDDFFGEMRKQDLAWGEEAGCTCAEAWWQHLGGGFQKQNLIQRELEEYIKIP